MERSGISFGERKRTGAYTILLKLPQKVGRPEKLDDEDIRKISDEITKLHNHQPYPIYPTYQDIFDFVMFTLKKIVKMDTLRKKSIINYQKSSNHVLEYQWK